MGIGSIGERCVRLSTSARYAGGGLAHIPYAHSMRVMSPKGMEVEGSPMCGLALKDIVESDSSR